MEIEPLHWSLTEKWIEKKSNDFAVASDENVVSEFWRWVAVFEYEKNRWGTVRPGVLLIMALLCSEYSTR